MCIQQLKNTIGNDIWMQAYLPHVKAALPQQWSTRTDIVVLATTHQKLLNLGVKIESPVELAKTMMFFERTGVIERRGELIKAVH